MLPDCDVSGFQPPCEADAFAQDRRNSASSLAAVATGNWERRNRQAQWETGNAGVLEAHWQLWW